MGGHGSALHTIVPLGTCHGGFLLPTSSYEAGDRFWTHLALFDRGQVVVIRVRARRAGMLRLVGPVVAPRAEIAWRTWVVGLG